MGEFGQLLPATSEYGSSSPGLGSLTPESSDGDGFTEDRDNVVADPLLGGGHDDDDGDGDDEVYELSGGALFGGGEGRGGAEKTRDGFTYTAEEEQAVVRKFDRRLVLFVALLYMLSFLDRSNIGNAYVAGMDEDLLERTGGTKDGSGYYEWALTSFYLAYIAFEWMSLLWTRIPAHIYVSAIVLSWGVVASLQAVATSYPVLIALRFLLGIGEAGFTGIPVYLSFFFKREELALRTAVFISAAPLATAFASSLAWLIVKLGEKSPIAPWRLLFLVEGFPGVVAATVAFRVIPDSPDKASYLTRREKKIARSRLSPSRDEDDDDDNDDDESHELDSGTEVRQRQRRRRRRWCWETAAARSALAVLGDPVPWATALIFCLTNTAYASMPVFLPSVLAQMGHGPLASQALAAPPHLAAFAAVLAAARWSDRRRSRALPLAACALLSSAGYAFLALSHGLSDALHLDRPGGEGSPPAPPGTALLDAARYLAVYPATVGFFCVVVLNMAWNVNNAAPGGAGAHKGAGFALMQVLGQCGPLVGTRLYPRGDGPWFTRGMAVCSAAMLAAAGLALGLRVYLARANRRLDREGGKGEGVGEEEEEEEGLVGGGGKGRYNNGGFRYML